MKVYKHIFFDLDHTLWDFDTNSALALQKIFEEQNLAQRGVTSFEHFHQTYRPINDRYWAKYHHGIVTKEQLRVGRFYDSLLAYNIIDTPLAEKMATDYLTISPTMTALFANAVEVLQHLQKKYTLHLITNGFAEVQWIKLEHSGLKPFFEHIIISEEVGTQKPDKKIFEIAMERASATADDCVMIGDNYLTDIAGAKSAGMDQIYFNPLRRKRNGSVTHEIYELNRLFELL